MGKPQGLTFPWGFRKERLKFNHHFRGDFVMDVRLRQTRNLKVTEVKLSEEELEQLASLFKDSRYQNLLDVMERACIEVESAHFSVSMADPESILGGFAVCKACWHFFTYVQRQVQNAFYSRAAVQEEEAPEPPTLEDFLQSVE